MDSGYMSCYNAGHELDWGISIIAAHRDGRIVLYHLPSDVWECIRTLRSTSDMWDENSGVLAQSDVLMDNLLSRPHRNTCADPSSGNEAALVSSYKSQRTVQIQGTPFAHLGRDIVDDVAVNTSCGGLSVWVFCRSGVARQYDIFCDRELRRRHVREDGLLYEVASGKGKDKVTDEM